MRLFKYVNSQRIDILLNGKIRFSQPLVWNDPFELQPNYLDDKPKNLFVDFVRISKIVHGKIEMPNNFKQIIKDYEVERKRLTKEEIYRYINNNILSLSLTEDRNNLLMWSHYADSHSGFVIEFDSDSEFFTDKNKTLIKINYPYSRPNVQTYEFADFVEKLVNDLRDTNKLSNELLNNLSNYLAKGPEWNYEKEWRLITIADKAENYKEFNDETKILHFGGGETGINEKTLNKNYVALFTIHPNCIKSIYCGKRMAVKNVRQLFLLIKNNPYFSHIKLQCCDIDEKQYQMNFREVMDYEILTCAELEYEERKCKKIINRLAPHIAIYEKEKRKYSKIKPAGNTTQTTPAFGRRGLATR